MKIVTDAGTIRDSDTYLLADNLIKLSKTKPLWEVIQAMVTSWKKTQPRKWKAHLVQMEEIVKTRRNKLASNRDKTLRYLVDFPEPIMNMIRIVYPPEVLPLDKSFFRTFAKKFHEFKVAQKI